MDKIHVDRPRKIILSYSDYDNSPRIKQKAYSGDRKFSWGGLQRLCFLIFSDTIMIPRIIKQLLQLCLITILPSYWVALTYWLASPWPPRSRSDRQKWLQKAVIEMGLNAETHGIKDLWTVELQRENHQNNDHFFLPPPSLVQRKEPLIASWTTHKWPIDCDCNSAERQGKI